jgi:hypothetical protein
VLNTYIKNNSSQNAKNKIIILNPPKIKKKPWIMAGLSMKILNIKNFSELKFTQET